jgi:cell division protease FtsH
MKVEMADFEFAKDKVMMGSERRSLVMSEEEKRITAYHEAGHALVAVLVPEADPLHKVTIIPRGMALGLTQQLPLEDRYTYSRSYLEANLRVLMGGRIAEEVVFGSERMTTGAGNDLERCTELARKMVCEWGMSERMGPLTFGKREESIFLGKEFARHQDSSEATSVQIDDEIRNFVNDAYAGARHYLENNRSRSRRSPRRSSSTRFSTATPSRDHQRPRTLDAELLQRKRQRSTPEVAESA